MKELNFGTEYGPVPQGIKTGGHKPGGGGSGCSPDELHSEGWLGEKAFGPDVYRSNETI